MIPFAVSGVLIIFFVVAWNRRLGAEIIERKKAENELRSSKKLMEKIINSLPFWLSVKDQKGRYMLVNKLMAESHGRTVESYVGQETLKSKELTPGGLSKMLERDMRVLATGKPAEVPEYVVDTPQGKRFRRLLKVPWKTDDNEVIGVISWSEDITKIKRMTEELDTNRKRLDLALEASNTGLWDTDIQENSLYLNDQWYRQLGYEPGVFINDSDPFECLLHKEDRERVFETVRQHLAGEVKQLKQEFRLRAVDKSWKWILSIGKIVSRDDSGKPKRMIGVHLDITEQKKAQQERDEALKLVSDSIQYAALIQSSLIPSNEIFFKYFTDHFVIWHPRDIVGGDIYLFDELRNDDECLLMVIDCTGHGVPGAFVTMLVKAIERQVVTEIWNHPEREVSPAWILKYFNRAMKKLLNQDGSITGADAGFDGGILYYNRKERCIKFAGASTPLFYIGNGKVQIIKGDRQSIGYKKSETDYEFKEHQLKAESGMTLYLTTDGYLDQGGGKKGFSFGKKRFKKIIESYADETMADQKEIFLYELADYQGDKTRRDDVTAVGLRI